MPFICVKYPNTVQAVAKFLWSFITPWVRRDVRQVTSLRGTFGTSPFIGLHIRRGDKLIAGRHREYRHDVEVSTTETACREGRKYACGAKVLAVFQTRATIVAAHFDWNICVWRCLPTEEPPVISNAYSVTCVTSTVDHNIFNPGCRFIYFAKTYLGWGTEHLRQIWPTSVVASRHHWSCGANRRVERRFLHDETPKLFSSVWSHAILVHQAYLKEAVIFLEKGLNGTSADDIEGIWVASDDAKMIDEVRTLAGNYFPSVRSEDIVYAANEVAGSLQPSNMVTHTNHQVQ